MALTETLLGVDYTKYACNIGINGQALPAEFEILSVQIKQGYQYITSANILLKTSAALGGVLIPNPLTMPFSGAKLALKAKLDFDEIDLFEGIIVKHKFKNSAIGTRIQLTAKTKAINAAINTKTETFAKLSDKDIIEELAQANGCTLNTTNITNQFILKHTQLVKNELNDWDFMNIRAEANSCYLFTEKDNIILDYPTLAVDPTKIITAKYGDNVFELELEQDDRCFQIENEIVSFDLSNLAVETTKEDPQIPSGLNFPIKGKAVLNNYRSFNDLEANNLLKAETQLKSISKTSGVVQIKANLIAKTGDTLEIMGFNEMANGKFVITSVLNDYSEGGFSTYLQFGLNFQSYQSKFNLNRNTNEPKLLTGLVVQLQDDPDNLNRILIKINNWNKAQENLWCRVSSLYAGDQYGFFCLPEIGDEVLVSFLGNSFDAPVVLGSVFSPSKPPHTDATDDNFNKVFITKKGMKWAWNDEKGIHEISTKSGNKIVISEDEKSITIEDENQNKIVMNDSEINFTATKDITIKANANVKIEGAMVEISSSGTAKIKGSMVMIN